MHSLLSSRFVVASHGIGAAYAAWLLRNLGADVQHVTALSPEGVGAFLAEGATFATAPEISDPGTVTCITDAPVTEENRRRLGAAAETARRPSLR